MSRSWFRQKRYGFGAAPASWQGWALTIVYVAAMVATALAWAPSDQPGAPLSMRFLAVSAALTIAYVVIAWRTTEGGWRWRWGKD